MGMYHRENGQEGFLVLAGACLLIVEGEKRELRAWDFFHCPPKTEHVIVGSGDGPALVLAVGARGLSRKGIVYTVSKVARTHDAGVARETTKCQEAYAKFPKSRRTACGDDWLPEF